MLSKQGILKQGYLGQQCNCSILAPTNQTIHKENLFLAVASPNHLMGRHPQAFRKQSVKPRVRKSLKAQKNEKQNKLTNHTSVANYQPKTTSSNSFVKEPKFQDQNRLSTQNREIYRLPLSDIQNQLNEGYFTSKTLTIKQENVEPKIIQQVTNGNSFKTNALQTRFSENYSQNKVEQRAENDLKPIKLDRAQSSGNFFIPKLKLNQLPVKRGVQWRSQFVSAQLQKSASKLTHRLTDLNVKCTESINEQESLRISEVVSESECSPSDTHRTETLPKRIKDLMHMKYSKMEGRKY